MKQLTLNNGQQMPALGLGTWENNGDECITSVQQALEMGYRHIDTAQAYGNEEFVGEGIQQADVPRNEIFLTTKVFRNQFETKEKAINSVEDSLKKLNTDYVDLLLVHWPFPEYGIEQLIEPMLEAQQKGLTQNIGVSNFTVDDMAQAQKCSGGKICLNQVEYHPTLSQKPVLDWIRDHDWIMIAYSPLGRGEAMESDVLKDIAATHDKSAAQVCLRWLIQQDNVAAIPKASSKDHIKSNFEIFDFELTEQEMQEIFKLTEQENRIVDPDFAPEWDNARQAA